METLIRSKILNNEKIKIANIYGHNAIVQRDFNEGLDVSQNQFDIQDFNCNITSATSITAKLAEVASQNFDLIALVRGGGDQQSFEVFNDIALANAFIDLEAITITAIGHTVNETLLDKLADRRFHLPHDYGAGLHLIVNKLIEEKSNSRAILIEEVKKDVTKQFEEQVKTLSSQLLNKNKEFEKLQGESAKQISQISTDYQKQLKSQSEELSKFKIELSALHEKNLKSAIQSETASLKARADSLNSENVRLQTELSNKKNNTLLLIILLIIGIVIGIIIGKL